jgi:hypothetical protein
VLSLKKTEVFFTTTELVKLNKDLQQAEKKRVSDMEFRGNSVSFPLSNVLKYL